MPNTTTHITTVSRRRRRPATSRRWTATAALVMCWLFGSACGFDVQTNRPYTPADGVNVDAGGGVVQVRSLLILSPRPGEGVVSATLTADRSDALVELSGAAVAADGTTTPLQVTPVAPVTVGTVDPVLLLVPGQSSNVIRVRAAGLRAGLTATLTLRFRAAGEVTVTALVVDANLPEYRDLPTR